MGHAHDASLTEARRLSVPAWGKVGAREIADLKPALGADDRFFVVISGRPSLLDPPVRLLAGYYLWPLLMVASPEFATVLIAEKRQALESFASASAIHRVGRLFIARQNGGQ